MRFSKFAYLFVIIVTIFICLYVGSAGTYDIKVQGFELTKLFENMWLRTTEGVYDIPSDIALWESIFIDDKAYVYYGFFPAIIRAIALPLLGDSWFGKIGFLSCLIACFVITSFTFLIVFESFRFWPFKNKHLKTLSICIIPIAFVIGGPVLGCILRPNLYEELILWGYAFSTVGIYGFIRFLDDEGDSLGLILLSIAASCAFISKTTFGAPLYLLVGVTFLILLYNKDLKKKKIAYLCLSLPGLIFQLWYNYVRFGNILTFLPTNAQDNYAQFIIKHGGLINPHRIKDLFFYYFIPVKPCEFLSQECPFFKSVDYILPNNQYFMEFECYVTPLLVMVPYSLLFYIGGLVVFVRALIRKSYSLVVTMLFFSIPFIFETLVILSFNACLERYKPEFLPLLLVLMFFCFRELKNYKFLISVLILCILSIFFYLEWAFGYGPG